MATNSKPVESATFHDRRTTWPERLKLNGETWKSPTQYKNVHPDVLAKPEDDALSFQRLEWIKTNREKLTIRQG